jgi:hypothetical protein
VKKLGLILEGGDEGPDLAAEEEVNSPVGLVTAIWNHAPKMEKAFKKQGIPWANFAGTEMADLVAYLQAVQRKP